jgi:hypothetical protein
VSLIRVACEASGAGTKDAIKLLHGPTNAYFRAPDTVHFGDPERRLAM